MKRPDQRPTVEALLNHAWIEKFVKASELPKAVKLDISSNLVSFRKTTGFQAAVIAFMVNLQVASTELEDLKTMFFKLDKDKSGTISRSELE